MRHENRRFLQVCRAFLSLSLIVSSFPTRGFASIGARTEEPASSRSTRVNGGVDQRFRTDGPALLDLGVANIDDANPAGELTLQPDARLAATTRPERFATVVGEQPAGTASNGKTSLAALQSFAVAIQGPAVKRTRSGLPAIQAASGLMFENSTQNGSASDPVQRSDGGAGSDGRGDGGNRGSGLGGPLVKAPNYLTPGGLLSIFPGDSEILTMHVGGAQESQVGTAHGGNVILMPGGIDINKVPYIASLAHVRESTPPAEGWDKAHAPYELHLDGSSLVQVVGYEMDPSGLALAVARPIPLIPGDPEKEDQFVQIIKEKLLEIGTDEDVDEQLQELMQTSYAAVEQSGNPLEFSERAAKFLPYNSVQEQQAILSAPSIEKRLEMIANKLVGIATHIEISAKAKASANEDARKYSLTKQRDAINKELGEGEEDDVEALKAAADKAKLPKEAAEKVAKEIKRLSKMQPTSAEATVARTWLERTLALPWNKSKTLSKDLAEGRKILDEDHYGMEKIKRRILERIAVLEHTGKLDGTIFCIVGPKGTGKTSLGKSIARATGRDFQRVALGGVEDESEIRGHRSTYIGAIPGRIMAGVAKLGSDNGLIMLDEIDKLGQKPQGGRPADALLEALDPKQNNSFEDHYFGFGFDLSKILFITTANSLDTIPAPLLDRMEIIRLEGYDEDEKVEIAKRHIIPEQLAKRNLSVQFPDETIRRIIVAYTREPGVRKLEESIGKILDRVVFNLKSGIPVPQSISPQDIDSTYLEDPISRDDLMQNDIGVGTGLWVNDEGANGTLPIEVVLEPRPAGASGDGEIKLHATGMLRDVMQESARVALAAIVELREALKLKIEDIQKYNYHLHIPDGATPKDGPSAGLVFATTITSALTKRAVKKGIAMTGEISAKGRALRIGGLKGKTLAAQRDGMTTVLYPAGNETARQKISAKAQEGLQMHPVKNFLEVVELALEPAAEAAVAEAAH